MAFWDGAEAFLVVCAVVVPFVMVVQHIRVFRYVDRENARRRAEYDAALADARRKGTVPPFPPNRLVAR
jgi:hypothetical protein